MKHRGLAILTALLLGACSSFIGARSVPRPFDANNNVITENHRCDNLPLIWWDSTVAVGMISFGVWGMTDPEPPHMSDKVFITYGVINAISAIYGIIQHDKCVRALQEE
jgi:hypothetical protein